MFPDGTDLSRAVVLHDGDLDGLGAAAIVGERLPGATFLTPPKGTNAWGPEVRDLLEERCPSALAVLDLGLRSEPVLDEVPSLYVDHHLAEGRPPGTVYSGLDHDPVPTTSLLAWRLFGTPENAWRAALGNVADLGPADPDLDAARKRQTIKAFDGAKSLLGTAKRCADPDAAVPAALRTLMANENCKAILADPSADAELLRHHKEIVKAEMEAAKRAAPKFGAGPVAVIRISSPCRIHPLLAQRWATQLPKHVALVANDGYLPGRVNFSARTRSGVSIVELLREAGDALGFTHPEYGHGHPATSGGSLPTEDFGRLLATWGLVP